MARIFLVPDNVYSFSFSAWPHIACCSTQDSQVCHHHYPDQLRCPSCPVEASALRTPGSCWTQSMAGLSWVVDHCLHESNEHKWSWLVGGNFCCHLNACLCSVSYMRCSEGFQFTVNHRQLIILIYYIIIKCCWKFSHECASMIIKCCRLLIFTSMCCWPS